MKSVASRDAPMFRVRHMDRSSRFGLALWTVLLIGLAALPFSGDRQTMRLLTEVYSYVALASLWNLLAGYAGLVSIGQQVFVGVGGYTLYLGALSAGLPPLLCIPLAAVLCGALAVPIVLLLFRLRGAYFTIGSWVIAELFVQISQQVRAVGGGSGISLPASVVKSIAQSRDAREFLIYWLFLAMVVIVIGLIVIILRTRHGLALTAIRDNEMAAKSNGIEVNRTRLIVFVSAAAASGMAGALIFLQKLSITPFSAFSINDWTINVIFITVIGGIGRVEGPIVGAIIFFVLREFLADYGSVYLVILGMVAIIVMLRARRGIWGYLADRYGWQLFPLARRLERVGASANTAVEHDGAPASSQPGRALEV